MLFVAILPIICSILLLATTLLIIPCSILSLLIMPFLAYGSNFVSTIAPWPKVGIALICAKALN
jgi:hypothetical protein